MGEMMTFPASVEEFMEQYKMTDTEHVYSNGTEFVPIYRMKQWFEHANYNGGSGVRHGRWVDNEDYMFCSCCGMQWNYCDNDTQDFHYCPNCGCKMDLEE